MPTRHPAEGALAVDEPPSARALRPGLAVLLGVASFALLVWVGAKPSLAGINSDGAVYVLLADWLSPWHAHDIEFGARLFEHYPFPPLYPLLLAALGGGSASPQLDYVIDAWLQACAVAASWCWARRAGCDGAGAALAALSIALTPIALFTAMGLFSEPLYLALSMTAFALVAGPAPRPRAWHSAALLLGLAAVSRGIGLFAVLALLLSWISRTHSKTARLTPLLAVAPPLLWMAVKASHGWHGSYTHNVFAAGWWPVLHSLIAQIPTNLHALAYHFVRCFDFLNGQHSAVIATLLLVPAAFTWVRRLRDAELDAIYLALYLGVIVMWPYPNHFSRFLFVLLPLFGAYAAMGVSALLSASGQAALARHGASLAAALLLLVVAPSFLQIVLGIATAEGAEEGKQARISSWYSHDSLAAARRSTSFSLRVLRVMTELGTRVPHDACVSATMAETFMLQARRYSRPPPSARDDVAALRAALTQCPYVLLLGTTVFAAADFPPFYPAARLSGELEILHSVARDPAHLDGPPLAVLARYRGAQAAAIAPARRSRDD